MIKNKIKAFTLIEMLIVISIIAIISIFGYLNFTHNQNKNNLKLSSKDVAQALYNTRNFAINGLNSGSGNLSVGIYFDNSKTNKNKFFIYSYPYNFDFENKNPITDNSKKIVKEISLNKGVEIRNVNDKDKFLFVFDAITGSGKYFYWEGSGVKESFNGNIIKLKLGLEGAKGGYGIKEIDYIVGNNIIDY